MSDDKFHLVVETPVGTLDETLKLEWERLQFKQTALEDLMAEQEQAFEAFWDAVERKFGHQADALNVAPRFLITDEGGVSLDVCPCPICQARCHGISATEAVEAMYKSDLLPEHVLGHMRKRAQAVDSANEMSKKMRN
jgi:hypothetical protein